MLGLDFGWTSFLNMQVDLVAREPRVGDLAHAVPATQNAFLSLCAPPKFRSSSKHCSRAVSTAKGFLTCPDGLMTPSSILFLGVPVMAGLMFQDNCVYISLPLLDMKDLKRGVVYICIYFLFCFVQSCFAFIVYNAWHIVGALF